MTQRVESHIEEFGVDPQAKGFINKEMRSDVNFREMTFAHLIAINLELLQGRIQEQWQ